MKRVPFAFLECFLFVSVQAAATSEASTDSLPAAMTINDVCEKLTNYFNVLTGIVPLTVHFQSGTDQYGNYHPGGYLILESSAKRVNSCNAILFSHVLAVQLAITNKVNLSIPELNATMDSCEVRLHYRLSPASSKQAVTLKVILAELSSLGKVTLQNGTDFSTEADVLIRPVLFEVFNRFSRDRLSFTINNQAQDTTNAEALSALQFVLKKAVLGLLNGKPSGDSTSKDDKDPKDKKLLTR